MENVTRALMIAFSMMMFVIGFTFSMYMINKLLSTSSVLLDSVSTTNYYDNIEVASTGNTTRDVGVETIVPVLYRYYKENYSVRIVDKDDSLIQLFDTEIETKIASAAAYTGSTDTQKVSLRSSVYNTNGNSADLFGAPWTANTKEYAKARIDYFLNGTKGYINNVLVDYSNNGFLSKYGTETFEESFVEYAYTGETISTEEGLETITGSTQESSKIIITYKLKK